MKRILTNTLAAACALAALCSATACRTQKTASFPALSGEWNIMVIGETAVSVPGDEEQPFLGFNTATGELYGSGGCNTLMGNFTENPKTQSLTIESFGLTRIACPDMTLEETLTEVLPKVASYRVTDNGGVVLTDSEGLPLVTCE